MLYKGFCFCFDRKPLFPLCFIRVSVVALIKNVITFIFYGVAWLAYLAAARTTLRIQNLFHIRFCPHGKDPLAQSPKSPISCMFDNVFSFSVLYNHRTLKIYNVRSLNRHRGATCLSHVAGRGQSKELIQVHGNL